MTCDFLYACAGYYDYDHGHAPVPRDREFAGQVVHPQFWPEDLDYAGKRVVVIGSGATAVTLVPADGRERRARDDAAAQPDLDQLACRRRTDRGPAARAAAAADGAPDDPDQEHRVTLALYQFCQRLPEQARKLLLALTAKDCDAATVAEHFTPTYDPWDQRSVPLPDGDLSRRSAVARPRWSPTTSTRSCPRASGCSRAAAGGRHRGHRHRAAAAGLRRDQPSVDGAEVDLLGHFVWQGAMLTGVPNFAVCIGYTNASWTLRADLTHRLVCKVLNQMDRHAYAAVVPLPHEDSRSARCSTCSGYIQRSIAAFPRQGDRGPWRVRQNYLLDAVTTMRRGLRGHRGVHPRSAVRRTHEGPRVNSTTTPALARAGGPQHPEDCSCTTTALSPALS